MNSVARHTYILGLCLLAQVQTVRAQSSSAAELVPDVLAAALMPNNSGDWVEVTDDPEAGELVFSIGPVNLKSTEGHAGVRNPPLVTVSVPIDGYLYGFELSVDDGRGNRITNDVLHHVNLIDPDHRELFSPVPRRLFAAGRETKSTSLPKAIGIPMKKGQRIIVVSMWHNPTGHPIPEAYLRVKLNYRQKGWFFPIQVHPVYIDVMGHIGEKSFDLPPGEYKRTWEGSPAVAGRLIAAGGHVHEYATTLRFEDVTAGELLWEIEPILDDEGKLESVPIGKFWWKGGVPLHPDHTYRFSVIYDNPTGETLVEGGMGVLGGVFKVARGDDWPKANPSDPQYIANVKEVVFTARRREQGMGGHGVHAGGAAQAVETAEHKHGTDANEQGHGHH